MDTPEITIKDTREQDTIRILDPKSGTATSSPAETTTSPSIINTMLWMKKEAYEA